MRSPRSRLNRISGILKHVNVIICTFISNIISNNDLIIIIIIIIMLIIIINIFIIMLIIIIICINFHLIVTHGLQLKNVLYTRPPVVATTGGATGWGTGATTGTETGLPTKMLSGRIAVFSATDT